MISDHSQLVDKLSRMSVTKRHDAYLDIDWDAPEHRIDPEDPRWELGDEQPLGRTAWYRALPQPTRARLGLHIVASAMKVGVQFESVLSRGLLEVAGLLPDDAADQRYAYHEVIEEAQHSLMFTEFMRRVRAVAPLKTPGLPEHLKPLRDLVIRTARHFPELFFVFVLGGEDPIDHVQRVVLGSERQVHPLLRRIMQIHVTEEARHLAFAKSYLRAAVPRLSPRRKQALAVAAPVVLAVMARLMLRPAPHLARAYRIPSALLARDPAQRARVIDSVADVRELLADLDLVRPALWRRVGLA